MAKPKYAHILTKEFLEEEYINKHKSTNQIGRDVGCSDNTVAKYMKKHGVKIGHNNPYKFKSKITKEFLIDDYIKNRKSTQKIATKVGCSNVTILNYLRLYNLNIRPSNNEEKHIHKLTKIFLMKEYIKNKKSINTIANEVGCSYNNIRYYMKKFNINRRHCGSQKGDLVYPNNQNYFDKWSHKMAYITGLCISDGSITGRKYKRLSFGNKLIDKLIIQFIRDEVSPTRPVRNRKIFDKRTKKFYYRAELCICGLSDKTLNKLSDLGIFQNNEGKEILPKCPKKYRGSLLRGIFDGDGWITNQSKNSWKYGICSSSKEFLKQIQKTICSNYGNILWNGKCWTLCVYRRKHISFLAKLMYQNDNCSLFRKKKRFIVGGFINDS